MQLQLAVLCFLFKYGLPQTFGRFSTYSRYSTTKLCGSDRQIRLSEAGMDSWKLIQLDPGGDAAICRMQINAPQTHLIHVQIVEDDLDFHRTVINKPVHPPCNLDIYLADNPDTPVWSGDLCSYENLKEVDLLTPEVTMVWQQSYTKEFTKGRDIVISAIGQGAEVCERPGQHTCMRIGWKPALCISEYLLCNGHENCPKSSTISDEDDALCKDRTLPRKTWKALWNKMQLQLAPVAGGRTWQQGRAPSLTSTQAPSSSSSRKRINLKDLSGSNRSESGFDRDAVEEIGSTDIGTILSQYGPWGYLILGLLISAVLLIFCIFWECCIRRQKVEAVLNLPTVVVVDSLEEAEGSPPRYEDLDQPPSYNTLFPPNKLNDYEVGETIQMNSINQ